MPEEMSPTEANSLSLREYLEEQKTGMMWCSSEQIPACQEQPAALYKSLSFKEMLETHKETTKGKLFKKKGLQGRSAGELTPAVSLSFSSFLRKKTRLSFKKWRINKMKSVSVDERVGIVGWAANGTHDNQGMKQENAQKLGGIPSGRVGGYRNTAISMQKKRVQQEEKGRDGTFELCKKRILMGEKCKPLNLSGTLQYDETGILLAEEI